MQPPEWKGASSLRFTGGRKHLHAENELGSGLRMNNVLASQGIKTFSQIPTTEQIHKPIVKLFPENYDWRSKDIDPRGRKHLYLTEQPHRIRPERSHLDGGKETHKELYPRGIKTFEIGNKSKQSEYSVDAKLQRKARINGLDAQRNHVGVAALGDKPYKYPDYAANFYKEGGLIPGSTQVYRGPNVTDSEYEKKLKSVFTKPNWDVKVKMDEEEEERRVVNSVDEWEQTTLREGNPNWKDPDKFFDKEEPKKGDPKKVDPKKGGKK